jgi:Na+-driven multidrug efflux pump
VSKKPKADTTKNICEPETEGIKTLLGDPKKAIIKLAIPMIVAMVVQTLYNLVDAIWVSGLGADALASVGFVFPFLFMGTAIATGLGIGGGSAISRKIGAKDKKGADNVAAHTIILMFIIAIIYTIPLFVFSEGIFRAIGAEQTNLTSSARGAKIVAFSSIEKQFIACAASSFIRGLYFINPFYITCCEGISLKELIFRT